MCSAPGSKTSQMLEALVSDRNGGCLVANDLNSSRLDVLTHQTNRCPGAHGHVVITNYDAMNYPLLQQASDKFDRVLCDVMCSGDGTLRRSRLTSASVEHSARGGAPPQSDQSLDSWYDAMQEGWCRRVLHMQSEPS